jgi:dipeptidyl aminopeptidase/acylaminoacyl peptidase
VITRSPSRVWIAGVNTGRNEMVKTGSRHIMGARWSPDGSKLPLTTASRPINDEEQLRPRLETVSIAGGEPRLYGATLGKINTPEWSPDGKSIAFLGSILADSAFYPEGLFVCRGAGSTPENLNPESDYSIDAFRWLGNGDAILVSIVQGAYRHLARLSPALPRPVRITGREYTVQTRSDFSSSNGGASQAFVAARYDRPPDVWVLDGNNGAHQVTHLNPHLEGLEYGKGEEVHWKARDDWDISGVLILPPGYKPGVRYPMVVHLHGSNSAELNDYQVTSTNWGQFYAAQGYIALMPNYRGNVTGGPKFSRASKHDWGGKDMTDVLDGVDAMVRKGIADADHRGISGISYGGYLTARTITQDTRFKTATLVSGISNWIALHTGQTAAPESAQKMEWVHNPYDISQLLWDRSPSAHLKDVKSATIIFWGEFDPAIPVTQAIELYRGLRHFGVPSKLIVYPRDGHVPRERNHMKDLYTRVNAWLRQYL